MLTVVPKYLVSIACLISLLFFTRELAAQNKASEFSRTIKIKSAVIFQLTRFIRPSEKSLKSRVMHICAIGDSELTKEISRLFFKQSAQHVKLQFESGIGLEQLGTPKADICDWLVVDRASVSDTMFSIIKTKVSVPLICTTKALSWDGCMIEIFEENNKARIGVNLDVVSKTGTNISSELLDLAILRESKK